MITLEDNLELKDQVLDRIQTTMGLTFSDEQKAVIVALGHPLAVLSGAGSGKTTVVSAAILFRELFYGISPAKMIAITFNKNACVELEERYLKYRGRFEDLNPRLKVTFKTYHALFYLILNSSHAKCSWEKVVDYYTYTDSLMNIIRKRISSYNDDTLETIMSIRGYQVNEMLSYDALKDTEKFITHDIDVEDYQAVIDEYERLKREDDAIDFDDMQILMLKEIQTNPKILDIIHSAWDYFIVDEYQDVSKVQLEILKLIVKDHNKLTIVGDDDQAIYEFRGSRPEYILDFGIHFRGANYLLLNTNYRVPENILNPIIKSITKNETRAPKTLQAFHEGGVLEYTPNNGADESAKAVAQNIAELRECGVPLSDIVILIRNNHQQRIIIDALLRKDVPVTTNSNFSLERHMVIRDYSNMIALAKDDRDREAFKAIAHKVLPYMKKYVVDNIVRDMRERGVTWQEALLNTRAARYNNSYHEIVDTFAKLKGIVEAKGLFSEALPLFSMLYEEYFYRIDSYRNDSTMTEIRNYMYSVAMNEPVTKFFTDLKYYDNLRQFYLSNSDDAVRISTIHRMKGLEYPYVFLLDATEETLPNASIEKEIMETNRPELVQSYLEQERRLFYVAATRASKYLNITCHNEKPSRFILEMLDDSSEQE